jgi:TPR repeat protein
MQSLAQRWRHFHSKSTEETLAPATKEDIDTSALKSVIRNRSKQSPTIDVITHESVESVSTIDKKEDKGKERSSFSGSSLLELDLNFIESTDTLNELKEEHPNKTVSQSSSLSEPMETLPTDPIFNSYQDLEQSLKGGAKSTGHLSCGSEFHDKWPIPSSIDEVHSLYEKEQSEGTPQSQLALCLHLMESAWQVDPSNNTALSAEQTKRQSNGMLEDIMSTLKQHSSNLSIVPSTLGEAMVMESRKLLKQLAHTSQVAGKGAEAEAQFLLGSCYGMGALGWPINHRRAFQWYFQASKYGHVEATYRTAVCYELGIGTPKDGNCALIFYRKAANLMHVPSMYKLGVILMRGYCHQLVSRREAVIWLQRAAGTALAPLAPGDDESKATTIGSHKGIAMPQALHALAIVHLTRECEGTSMITDFKYALKLLHNAARLGYAPSQFKLGECYECGYFCPEDEAQSIYWYTLAAQQDYAEACLALSGWYLTGSLKTNMLMQSDQEAYLWARKSAKLAKYMQLKTLAAKAYYTLGVYSENGIGVPKSIDMANKWFKKAAQYGHTDALKMNII